MNKLHITGAAVLIVAAFALMLTGTPTKRTPVAFTEEIAGIVSLGDDRVSPVELAEWIVGAKPEVRLIDVRSAEDYEMYHIEGSINIPFTQLLTRDGLARLSKLNKNALICGDGANAAKAWVVLRSKGYEAYILDGGVKAWVDQILTPGDKTDDSYNGRQLAAKVQALREHFLGDESGKLDLNKSESQPEPPPPAVKPPVQRRKKVAGGC